MKENSILVSTIQEADILFPLKLMKPHSFRPKKIQDRSPVKLAHRKVGDAVREVSFLISKYR